MLDKITQTFQRSIDVRQAILADQSLLDRIMTAATRLVSVAQNGGTIYACGNGGSACDAMHFVEELVAQYKRQRPGIKAMHFADPGTLTCWSNDHEYRSVFARQVETFCSSNDALVVISTSGTSPSAIEAARAAKRIGTCTIGLGGRGGGKLKDECDIPIIVPATETERIQELHITIIHIFCELLEDTLYPA